MALEFGMPTLLGHNNLRESAAFCASLGLRFLELNMNLPQYQLDSLGNLSQLREIAAKYGIYYTIHLDENLNVCDFNPAVASAWRDTVNSAILIARNLEIPVLNMHLSDGVYFTLPGQKVYLFEKYAELYLDRMKKFRDACTSGIAGSGIAVCVENTGGFLPFQKQAIELLLESPAFGLTWDVGHSYSYKEQDLPCILERGDRLLHMHLHDAVGLKNHLPLGCGEIPLPERLETAKQHGCRCVIETKTPESLTESVGWLKANGYLS